VAFEPFTTAYGRPQPGTAADMGDVPPAAQQLVDAGAAGIYGDGFLSLASVREAHAGGLGAWASLLPRGAQLFGSTCFGLLFVIVGDDDLYLVDTQYGQVIDSEPPLDVFLDTAASDVAREDLFRQPLFRQWVELNGPLARTQVLSPTPAPALGGDWALAGLQALHLATYLQLTAQFFGPGTGVAIEYR
jgi:Domain of unknown function (DUF1851)